MRVDAIAFQPTQQRVGKGEISLNLAGQVHLLDVSIQGEVVLTPQLVVRPRVELVVTVQKDATGLDRNQSNVINPAEDL